MTHPARRGGTLSVDERTRHALHQDLERTLGPESAAALMSYLPPVGWADVATKRDLDALQVATTRDLALLGGRLRMEMSELGGELRTEMSQLRAEMHAGFASHQRAFFFQMVGVMVTLVSLTWLAARLG